MALYELDAPRGTVFSDIVSRMKRSFGAKLRRMEYARMVDVMGRMRKEDLDALGLTRADIPRHARECIYGDQD